MASKNEQNILQAALDNLQTALSDTACRPNSQLRLAIEAAISNVEAVKNETHEADSGEAVENTALA